MSHFFTVLILDAVLSEFLDVSLSINDAGFKGVFNSVRFLNAIGF